MSRIFPDDSSQYIDLGNWDAAGVNTITIGAWVYFKSFPNNQDQRVIMKGSGSGEADHQFMIGHTSSGPDEFVRSRIRLGGGTGTVTLVGSTDMSVDTWYFIAATYSGDDASMNLYLGEIGQDVNQEDSAGFSNDLDKNTDSVYIGRGVGFTGGELDGYVSEVFVSSDRIYPAELNLLARGHRVIDVHPQNLDFYAPLGMNDSARDFSKYGRHGTLVGYPELSFDPPHLKQPKSNLFRRPFWAPAPGAPPAGFAYSQGVVIG